MRAPFVSASGPVARSPAAARQARGGRRHRGLRRGGAACLLRRCHARRRARGARGLPGAAVRRGRRRPRAAARRVPARCGASAGPRGDRPRALGHGGPTPARAGVAAARGLDRVAGRGQRDDRRCRSRRRRKRGGSSARSWISLPEGQGRAGRRRRPARRRAGRGRPARSRSASTPTAAGRCRRHARRLRALEPVGIELCEEPVSGLEQIAAVAAETAIPIAIDESSSLPGRFDERVCAAVCLKVSRCGGITGIVDAAARARAAGYDVYLASTLDGPLGIAAALHAAAAISPDRPCGLATLPMFEDRTDPMPAAGGTMRVPDGAGARRWPARLVRARLVSR